MALVKFYRGNYAKYNKTTHLDGVYFAEDKQIIVMNGVEYGGVNMHAFDGFIKNVDVEGQNLTFKKAVDNEWVDVTIKLLEAADSSIELGTITKDGVNDGSTIKLKAVYDTNEDGDGLRLDATNGVKVVLDKTRERLATIEGAETVDGSIKKALKDAKDYTDAEIKKLDVEEVGKTGKFIQSIKEEDGKIVAVAADLNSTAVLRTATEATDDKVAVTGTTVEAAIESLATSIKHAEKADAKYTVKKVTEGLEANVKEAYRLVETVNGASKDVDVLIPIYKDSSLKSVALADEDDKKKKGQFLVFTYILEDGSEKVVYLDCSKFLVESEFKKGLEVSAAGEVSVKVEDVSATETQYLSVSENGVKVSGIDNAIKAADDQVKKDLIGNAADEYNTMGKLEDKIQEVDAKASAAHTKVNAKDAGHVTVTVETKTTDKGVSYSEVTVAEDDIASKADLDAEIAARKAVDGQSGQTYAANASANYIADATSLNDADVKIDAALKTEADRAAAAEDKIEASVGLAADGSHITTSGNYTSKATTIAGEIAALDTQVKANADAISDATVAEIGGTGKVITTVSQTNGKIAATAIDLTATNVAFTAITGATDKFNVDAANVQNAIAALSKATYDALSWIDVQ